MLAYNRPLRRQSSFLDVALKLLRSWRKLIRLDQRPQFWRGKMESLKDGAAEGNGISDQDNTHDGGDSVVPKIQVAWH